MEMLRITGLLAALAILAGCATAAQRRQGYIEDHPDLKPEIAAAILEGRVMEEMTADDVRAAWGDPERETKAITETGEQNTWSYPTPIGQFSEGKVILIFTGRKLVKLIN
jgi:hypothetical protein